jgi:hypothetical protein
MATLKSTRLACGDNTWLAPNRGSLAKPHGGCGQQRANHSHGDHRGQGADQSCLVHYGEHDIHRDENLFVQIAPG